MRIVVEKLPIMPHDCLFSKWNCEHGWLCNLYRIKEKDSRKRFINPEIPYCDAKNCPYLKEER